MEKLIVEARCLSCEKPCDPLMYFCPSCRNEGDDGRRFHDSGDFDEDHDEKAGDMEMENYHNENDIA